MEDTDLEERYMADYHSGRAWKWLLPRTEEDGPIEYSYATPETRQFVGTDDDAWVYAYNGRDIRAELARKSEEERAASGRGYESDGAAEDLGGDDVRSVTLSLESEAASDDEQSTAESVDEDNVRSIAESSDEEDVSSYEEDVSSYEEEISDDEVVARPAGGKSRGKTYGGAAVLIPQDQESDDESVVAPSSPPYKPARKAPVSAKAKPAARKSPAPSSQEVSNDGEFYSSIAERRKMMSRGGQQSVVKTKRSYVEVEDEDEDEDESVSELESDESDFESSAHVSKKRKVQPAGKTAPVETPSPAYAPARKTVPAQKSAPLKKAAPARKAAPSRKRKTRGGGDDDDDSEDDIELDRKASTKKPKTQKGQRKERRETVDSDNIITVDINAVATKEAPKLTEWRNLPGLPDDEDHEAHEGVPGSKWSRYESAALYYCIVDRRNREIDENLVPLRDTNLYKLMSMNIKYSFGVDRTHTACKMHLNRYIKEDKDYDYQGQGSTGATSSQKRKTESQ